MSESTRARWTFWSVLLPLVLAGYVGTYYAIVYRYSEHPFESDELFPEYIGNKTLNKLPTIFFAPVHVIDRRIRPDHWRVHRPPPHQPPDKVR